MLNDLYGRPLAVGDAVCIKGCVISLSEDVDFINCVIKLDEPMPPSGAEVKVQLNSRQIEKASGEEAANPAIRPKPKAPPCDPPSHITSKDAPAGKSK